VSKLGGKVAVVTGGSRGIGLAIASWLAEHGATVVVSGRDADRLQAATKELERHGAPVLGEGRLDPLGVRQQLGGVPGQQRPGGREPQPAPVPLGELLPGLPLQPRELLRHRRGGHVQRRGRPGDGPAGRDRIEHPQPLQVQPHHATSTSDRVAMLRDWRQKVSIVLSGWRRKHRRYRSERV